MKKSTMEWLVVAMMKSSFFAHKSASRNDLECYENGEQNIENACHDGRLKSKRDMRLRQSIFDRRFTSALAMVIVGLFGLGGMVGLPGCSAEVRGVDSDGDGLSDKQEQIFGTNPNLPDTDGDTIPDALDPDPLGGASITLTPTVVSMVSDETMCRATIAVTLKDGQNRWIDDDSLQVRTTFGELSPIQRIATGVFEMTIVATQDGAAEVSFKTNRVSTPETIYLEFKLKKNASTGGGEDDPSSGEEPVIDPTSVRLEKPGINPGRYAKAGKMSGELFVMAIDGQTLDWDNTPIRGYAKAYVQVELSDGNTLIGETNASGWVHFADERLVGEVTVTVGAKGARYVSFTHVDAKVLSVPIVSRDITQAEAKTQGGTVTGTVRGFWGETGLPSLPKENVNVFDTINIAIVQVGIRNTPLSSMNTGSILRMPSGDSSMAEYFEIPPNLVLSNAANPSFKIDKLIPGKYVVFALAGAGGNIMIASQNPYELKFKPMAIGLKEFEVKAGETVELELPLTIDLRTNTDTSNLHFGRLPVDPESGKSLPMGLILPMIHTGKGFIFLDVNSAWNLDNFTNPVVIVFPKSIDPVLQNLGLSIDPMVVGLAARRAVSGFDRPGISTLISHVARTENGLQNVYMNDESRWPRLPQFILPAPPQSTAFDAVGDRLERGGKIAWKMDEATEMTILRFNYMTPPIHNKVLDSDIGASQAHLLWEIYVPSPYREATLPVLNENAPDYPVLVNYEPTKPSDAYQYSANTIELEINAYSMGPKPFNYQSNFLLEDVNLNSWGVSQDSYLVSVDEK